MQAVTKICSILLQVARLMQVHTIVTKQYSEGLGKTLPELKQYLTNIKLIVKTELGLLQANKQVFLVEDAAISRSPTNKANAIARLLDVGCIITNSESVVFERLGDSNHEAFKAISKLIR